jgi:hypothetical protein
MTDFPPENVANLLLKRAFSGQFIVALTGTGVSLSSAFFGPNPDL